MGCVIGVCEMGLVRLCLIVDEIDLYGIWEIWNVQSKPETDDSSGIGLPSVFCSARKDDAFGSLGETE